MDKMTFDRIDEFVSLAQHPIEDEWLDTYCAPYMSNVVTRMNYYRFLYFLIRSLQPRLAVELGVEFGCASAHMTRAAQWYGGYVVGVDLNWHNGPGVDIPTYCRYYKFLHTGSLAVQTFAEMTAVIERRGKIGVLFQDSSHHYADSVLEWQLWSLWLDEGAVWICDDITESFFEAGVDEKSMVGYWDELPGRKKLYPDVLHRGNTIGVMIV